MVVIWIVTLSVFSLIVGIAAAEYRSRQTQGVLGFSVADYQAEAENQQGSAPDFTLPSLQSGRLITLSSFYGHITVVNFWGSWCAPCRIEAPGLEQAWEVYRTRGVRFLGVDERDNDAAGRAFVSEFDLGYPSVTDPSGRLAAPYGLFGMPTTFVIDAQGQLRYRFVGYLNADILRLTLDTVLRGSTG
jgi:peroxiredoxin